ncbi:hypothetical protein JCM6882_007903 [Rhodosporidiobolus microsporus]
MPPSARPPSRSSFSPRLPYDVLHRIVTDAVGEAVKPAERDVARAVSLVCRDLRDVGQGFLWSTFTLPRRDVHVQLEGQSEKRLSSMIRRLRWEEKEGGYNDENEWVDPQADVDVSGAFALFLSLVLRLDKLIAVDTFDLSGDRLARAMYNLSSSPSRPFIASLTLSGDASNYRPSPSAALAPDELQLVQFLLRFPSLSSFASDLGGLAPPPALSVPTSFPSLSLRHLSLGIRHELPADVLTPSSPYHLLLSVLDPDYLISLRLCRRTGNDGWVRWLGTTTFSHLTSIDIVSTYPLLADFFPLLSHTISRLPTVSHLRLEDSRGVGIRSQECALAFKAFLHTLPPSLHSLDFVFRGTDIVLEPYLYIAAHPSLRRVLCKVGAHETIFERTEEGWQRRIFEAY